MGPDSPPIASPRAARWRWLAAVAAVIVGAYLLAWAWRWPHADMRNAGATLTGGLVLSVGLTSSVLAWRFPGLRWLVTTPPGLAAVMGFFAFAGVTQGQEMACGTALEACGSLLPGF